MVEIGSKSMELLQENMSVMRTSPFLDLSLGVQPSVESLDSGPQSPQYPGDINQALIELGSTVCKVREPNCDSCPLQLWCSAYQNSRLTTEEKVVA